MMSSYLKDFQEFSHSPPPPGEGRGGGIASAREATDAYNVQLLKINIKSLSCIPDVLQESDLDV